MASCPVRLDRIGTVGALKVRPAAMASNSGKAGSMPAEWKAWLTVNGVTWISCRAVLAIGRVGRRGRDTTTEVGPLIAAMASAGGPASRAAHVVLAGRDGDHRPGRAGLHQPATGAHQHRGLGKGEHPGDIGGGQFPDGMAQQIVRGDPDRPTPRAWPRPRRTAPAGRKRFDAAARPKWCAAAANMTSRNELEMVIQGRADFVEGGGEDAVVMVELAPMAGYWAPWPGNTNTVLPVWWASGGGGSDGRWGWPRAQRGKACEQIRAGVVGGRGVGDRRPVGVVGAGGGQAVGHIGQVQIGVVDQVLMQPVGLGAQALRGCAPRPATPAAAAHHTGSTVGPAGSGSVRVRPVRWGLVAGSGARWCR